MFCLQDGNDYYSENFLPKYMTFKNCLILLSLLFSSISYQLQAQPPLYDQKKPPKLGLVLSGGGAKGIIHVGILKALEEEGIRPDFITGTSMGSIIGGLYAIGYTADQLDTIVRSINWDMVLSNNIPLNFISYEEKEYYNRYLLEFPVENWKLKLPSGMIEGQTLNEVLNHYTWPANKYRTFADFPIPFRCIATDVCTGKAIVFKEGSLSVAIRASMAIPTAFTAVDLDSTLAVDGGVVNNFPVEELFEMGADIVIGVDVGDGFIKAKDLSGMTDILFQVSMFKSLERIEEQIAQCEIYIRPNFKGYGTSSFSDYAEILELGYKTGEEYRPQFKELKEKYGLKEKKNKGVSFISDPITIEEITITGNKWSSEKLISNKLGIEKGNLCSQDDIEDGVRRVYGVNIFKKVNHYITRRKKSDNYTLILDLDEKPRILFKSALHHDNTFSTGITLNMTLRDYLFKSSRFILSGDLSKNPKFRFDYLQYIGNDQSKAFNFRYNFLNEQIPTYDEGQLQDVDITTEHNFTFGFLTTQRLEKSYYVGGGIKFNTQKTKFSYVIPDEIKHGNFNNFKIENALFINTMNDRNYPTRGKDLSFHGDLFLYNFYNIKFEKGIDSIYFTTIDPPDYLNETEFNNQVVDPLTPGIYGLLQFRYFEYIPLKPKNQLIPYVSAGLTLAGDEFGIFEGFRIGGYQMVKSTDVRCYGLNFAEKEYENYLLTGLHFQQVLLSSLFLNLGVDFLLPYDYISLNELETFDLGAAFNDNSLLGYGGKLTYKSFIGPISVGTSRNTRDSYWRYYFALGFSFNYSD
jgi:NTE family protein